MSEVTKRALDSSVEPDHVVHVIGALHTGGAEKMLVNFLEAVDKKRFRHTVICLTARGDLAAKAEAAGVPVIVFPVRLRRLPLDVVKLARWFRRHQVRVVHSHMHSASLWARLAGLVAGVRVLVTTEHGKEPWKKHWQSGLDRALSRLTYHHIAVSDDVRQIRIRRDGFAPAKISLIPNGVPIPAESELGRDSAALRAELGFEASTPVLGSVGRVIEAKAYPDLLQALALARREVPALKWLQIGDGPDCEKLRGLASEAGLAEAVVFMGRRTDIAALLGVMDVWVMSSIREGLPVALLEAMAAARPIVATRVGGIPDAVDAGVEALLVPASNPAELAGAIVEILRDPGLGDRLASAARARAIRDYGIDSIARRIEQLYRSGLGIAES